MTPPDRPSVNWRAVAVFYGVACGVSWPLFAWRDLWPDHWAGAGLPGVVRGLLPALGPALGAGVALLLFRRTHRRTVGLLGSSPARSGAFVLVPVGLVVAVGMGGDRPHLRGLLVAGVYLLYGLGEELGWRGFLQDAVRPLAPARRYVTIGLLWGAWHFTSFAGGPPAEAAVRLALMTALWVLGSWGIGTAVDHTRSLAVAVMLHLTFNLFNALPRPAAAAVLLPSIAAWVWLIRGWPRAPGRPPAGGT